MAEVHNLTVHMFDGDRLKVARRVQGLKRSDVARHVGVTKQEVTRWEEGDCDIPVGQATALSGLFGLSVPWLTGAVGLPAGWRGDASP